MTNLEIPSEHSGATFLEGQLLVAMPRMTDRRFRRSVVYLCAHSREGAMGLIINRPASDIRFADLLDQLSIQLQTKEPLPDVHFGGPVEHGRGFVLHSGEYGENPATLKVNNVFAMLRAVDAGLGIADVPDYMASTMPRLVKVLPENVGPVFDLYFIYPSDLRRSKRVAAFRDFLGHVPGRGVAG